MDVRLCFRVRERRDVDLVLGQGMLSAGWNAHRLNAPGKFLISTPEHDTPTRARAFLVTDHAVSQTVTRYAHAPPTRSRVMGRDARGNAHADPPPPKSPTPAPSIHHTEAPNDASPTPEDALWIALCAAPPQGWAIGDLIRITGIPRATPLQPAARARGSPPCLPGQPWPLARPSPRVAVTLSDRLTVCLVSRLARVCTLRANTADETRRETTTQRNRQPSATKGGDHMAKDINKRIAAEISWARTYDRSVRTRPAREVFLKRFETEVDPDGTLPPQERHERAEHAYMLQLAKRAAATRRTR
jgi:hypothetical protein